jgi:hypothetical protein
MLTPPMKSPVLLLTFNRPDTTEQVIDSLRQVKPSHVFVFSDGPRAGVKPDPEKISATRQIISDAIDWPATVVTNYMTSNRGIVDGPPDAIDWFFSRVEEGVIVEDDCVAHPDFYYYCDDLLKRYRNDERVWAVSGDNSWGLPVSAGHSYGFISDPLIWGWATWKRAWTRHDRAMTTWHETRKPSQLRALYPDQAERKRRLYLFDTKPQISWDYQWTYTVNYHRGLVAVPRTNLVSNVGFNRDDATHTTSDSPNANAPVAGLFPLTHPDVVARDPLTQREWVERALGVRKRRLRYKIAKRFRQLIRQGGRLLGR